jgi:Fe-S-cluster formation regulator IscX/YfhJ
MAIDFSAFDQKVNMDELQKEVAEAKEFEDVPDGEYIVSVEKMEITETKKKDKLMFSVQCKIKEGDYKGRLIFFNRVITGNSSPKWTDGQAIKSVLTWLNKLETEVVPEFINYADFADCVLDIFQEIQGKVELSVEYAADSFNPISIKEAFDC